MKRSFLHQLIMVLGIFGFYQMGHGQANGVEKANLLEIQAAKIILPIVHKLLEQIPPSNQVESKRVDDFIASLKGIAHAAISFSATQVNEYAYGGAVAIKNELTQLRMRLTQLTGTEPLNSSDILKKFQREQGCALWLIKVVSDEKDPNSLLSYFSNHGVPPSLTEKLISTQRAEVYTDLQGLFQQGPRKINDALSFISHPKNRQKTIDFLMETEKKLEKLTQSLSIALKKQWSEEKVKQQRKKAEVARYLKEITEKYHLLQPKYQSWVAHSDSKVKMDKEFQEISLKKNKLEMELQQLKADMDALDQSVKNLQIPMPSWCEEALT